MYEVTEKILREVRKVIVGKDDVVEKVWISILAQGHVLLEDVPGVGKTTMALAFSKALGLETKRVQFTPDTMPSDIIGFSLPEQGRMVYQPGCRPPGCCWQRPAPSRPAGSRCRCPGRPRTGCRGPHPPGADS